MWRLVIRDKKFNIKPTDHGNFNKHISAMKRLEFFQFHSHNNFPFSNERPDPVSVVERIR